MSERPHVLVIEDGHEYSESLGRFLSEHFAFTRAGDGPEALALLSQRAFCAIFLDMRFDRAAPERLLGDLDEATERFSGDRDQARRFLENNQGAYILAAVRAAGHRTAVVWSYDFDGEPRRWKHMEKAYAPLAYLSDSASPQEIRQTLERACAHP
ncbi:MAG: response regulator [Myxococcota bacterium]|nr:response regulator [Myxococcota bacterium]